MKNEQLERMAKYKYKTSFIYYFYFYTFVSPFHFMWCILMFFLLFCLLSYFVTLESYNLNKWKWHSFLCDFGGRTQSMVFRPLTSTLSTSQSNTITWNGLIWKLNFNTPKNFRNAWVSLVVIIFFIYIHFIFRGGDIKNKQIMWGKFKHMEHALINMKVFSISKMEVNFKKVGFCIN